MQQVRITAERINSAFTPSSAIDDPKSFIGRKTQLGAVIANLSQSGNHLLITGLRGVGKSSFSKQIINITQGDMTLINRYNWAHLVPDAGYNYLVHSVSCDSSITCFDDLLHATLVGNDKYPGINSMLQNEGKSEGSKITRRDREFNLGLGEAGGVRLGISTESHQENRVKPKTSQQIFKEAVRLLQAQCSDCTGLLVVVDEFDTLKNKDGAASFIKSLDSDFVKFVFCGVATDAGDLIADHSSISRQLTTVNIPIMENYELNEILERALIQLGSLFEFDNEAKRDIVAIAEGFPYFVHFLGRKLVVEKLMNNDWTISANDLKTLLKGIHNNELGFNYYDRFRKVVGNSWQKERLLALFALEESEVISSTPVYAKAKQLGISNPSQTLGHINASRAQGEKPVLHKIRNGEFRFDDPLFKVYVRLKESVAQ